MGEESTQPGIDDTGEALLIVEDSQPIRRILSSVLQAYGFSTIEYKDGSEVVLAFEERRLKKIIGVFSDIMMPNMDGLELLGYFKGNAELAEIPFILITANPQKDFVIEAKGLGVNGFLVKPIETEKVLMQLKKMFPNRDLNKLVKKQEKA